MKQLILSLCILNSFWGIANTSPKDSLSCTAENRVVTNTVRRNFSELENILQNKKKTVFNRFTTSEVATLFQAPSSRIIDDRDLASITLKKVETEGKWVDTFTSDKITSLPVGIKQTINEVEYQLGIHEVIIYPDYALLTIFGRIILPQTDEKGQPLELFFGANNIKLSNQGGITGPANLVLLGDVQIPFNGGNWLLAIKGGADLKTGNVQNKTYITIDCEGVKEMGIEGEVIFSKNLILPIDPNGAIIVNKTKDSTNEEENKKNALNEHVKGTFSALASDWNNLLVKISLPSFVLADKPDKFIFTVNEAIFDFSDTKNDEITFPKHYYDQNLLKPSPEVWRGVFVKSLQVGLPQEFKTKESASTKKRVFFEATNLIIDQYGVSGHFAAEKVIPIDKGITSETKAWSFSVDKIGITIASNTLVGADFEGQIVLPIGKKEAGKTNGLKYFGLISENEYALRVAQVDTLDFSVWKAKAQLLPESSIEFKVINGNFRPKATLHGNMSITTSQKESNNATTNDSSKAIEFKGITFNNLVLQTESPIFSVEHFGYNDEVKLINFPVSIADIALTRNDNTASLAFNLKINLMDNAGFSADARLKIVSRFGEEEAIQKWKFDTVKLEKIYLEADMGGFKMNGDLTLMEDDEEYGNGFSARLQVEMAAMEGMTIEAKAIFGKTIDTAEARGFRYWYFDALIDNLPTANSPTMITLKGFGGGAFYHMERKGFSSAFSPSGLAYKPNKQRGLGLKAMVLFGVVNPDAINGGAGFEILFNTNGGINKMGFYGEGHIMQSFDVPNPAAVVKEKMVQTAKAAGIDDLAKEKLTKQLVARAESEYPAKIKGEAGLHAFVGIEHDFENKTLHGEFDMYVNVANDIIQGRASGGRAGWAVLHLSKEKWYLHMGTPSDRLGLIFKLGVKIEAGGYFMIGDEIPGSPAPPQEVADILGVSANSLNYMRDENALKSGKGFAFGQDFKVDTGDIKFLIMYARLKAGGGYDIMLKDYGEAECSNTGSQVGINGWYANGQGYAYIDGRVGIKIKLFFKKKRIDIFRGGGAVLLQTKAPNPIWMRGYFGGQYRVLGGLIKGRFRFKVTLGEECKFEDASPIEGMQMIADVSPANDAKNIDIFTTPQASFSFGINQDIVMPEDEGIKTYRILLDKYALTDEKETAIKGAIQFNDANDRVTFVSEDILPPSTQIKLNIEVSFQEKINGIYKTIEEDGIKTIESKEILFTTGAAPTTIPLQNIEYCYPIVDQKNYYKDESNTGYIKLKRGQDYLFEDTTWVSEIVFLQDEKETARQAISYNKAINQLDFKIIDIEKDKTYNLEIKSKLKNTQPSIPNQQPSTTVKVIDINEENTIEITQNKAETLLKGGENTEITRLSYGFNSSKYLTFADKINDIKTTQYVASKSTYQSLYLMSFIKTDEIFEISELTGNQYTNYKPLVSQTAVLNDAYYNEDINPVLYHSYPLYNKYFYTHRDTNILGAVPIRAIPVSSSYLETLKYAPNDNYLKSTFPYSYCLPYEYEKDFANMRQQIANDFNTDAASRSFLDKYYRFIRDGKYVILLQYHFPDGLKTGSSTTYTFKK